MPSSVHQESGAGIVKATHGGGIRGKEQWIMLLERMGLEPAMQALRDTVLFKKDFNETLSDSVLDLRPQVDALRQSIVATLTNRVIVATLTSHAEHAHYES